MEKPDVRKHFKCPEGRYTLHSAKAFGTVAFQMRRGTRMTVAALHGGVEEGLYMVFNIGEVLHITPFDATDREPVRTLQFYPTAMRDGFPCVHAHSHTKDGLDLIVGIANGEVLLMSLRAQLQLPQGSSKPLLAATLNADNAHDSTRTNALAWVPRADGGSPTHFLSAHASGTVLVYRKGSVMGAESSSGGKLLSHLSSKSHSLNPVNTLTIGGGGINDAAFSPDGTRLALACRDGTLRLLDWPSGQCVGGFTGYYGALLCCAWSPDGRIVASGGEDDLVTLYSLPHRQVLAFGEGHDSWVSRVAFDAWVATEPLPVRGGLGGDSDGALMTRQYRIGSAGQDTCLCLWDLVLEEDPSGYDASTGQTGLKRVTSTPQVGGIPTVTSSSNLASLASLDISSGGGGVESLPRQSSGTLLSLLGKQQGNGSAATSNPIAPSVPRADMTMLPPVMQHRVHAEPLSDVLFTEEAIFTSCCSGQLKCWLRPELLAAADQQKEEAGAILQH